MLNDFLATLSPMQAAKARAALEMQVRHNGQEFLTRHALIERKVSEGATIGSWRNQSTLQMPNGAFLDQRNATLTGLDYARFLIDNR